LSTSTTCKPFVPGNNSVLSIPFKAHKIDEFSPEILETHYEEFYGTAIRRLNILEREIYQVDSSKQTYRGLLYVRILG